jgi:hypothetical protein
VNEEQQAVYNVLSTREYTAGATFGPRIPAWVPSDHFRILKELEAMNRAELVYGQGWRAIEDPDEPFTGNGDERALYREWQARVAQGLTVLGYPEWVRNMVITQEANEERERRGKGD